MSIFKSTSQNFLNLFYPRLCIACGENKPPSEQLLCIPCEEELPQTDFHHIKNNILSDKFWGRVDFEFCSALYYFDRGDKVQRIIHHLKYNNRPEVGVYLGEYYGNILKKAAGFPKIDYIVPVPLHPKKQYQRGYNQAAKFGEGLSTSLQIPLSTDNLIRNRYTQTQTKKSRLERLKNVESAFDITQPNLFQDKHILLVDDVVTTGATLETCILELLKTPNISVSLVCIALASQI